MSEHTTLPPPGADGCAPRILSDPIYRRALAARSGLSGYTLRQFALTGRVQSYVTALTLERATDGEVRADLIADPNAKGVAFYRNRSARALLDQAMKEGVTLARLLGRHGLTTTDLWTFVNAREGKCSETKERVSAMLEALGLPIDQDKPQ